MSYRTIPGSESGYYLMSVDEDGVELVAPTGTAASTALCQAVQQQAITDVFIWNHGWKGDVPGAIDQYNRWIGAFLDRLPDREQQQKSRPAFKELHLGFHWPSLSWGDEKIPAGVSFAAPAGVELSELVDFHARQLGNSQPVRDALNKLFDELKDKSGEDKLPARARDAYLELNAALDLGEEGRAGDGAADRPPFDPVRTINDAENMPFGIDFGDIFLSPLRQLTFWTMKKRAQLVGEKALHDLLTRLQQLPDNPGLRIHLMGHSFGCIVASAGLAGPGGDHPLPRAVESCVLVQGALSLWAYAPMIPFDEKGQGYFHSLLAGGKLSGPLVATVSSEDYAVGRIYPWAAGVADQVAMAIPTKYGALGTFGIWGVKSAESLPMKTRTESYQFNRNGIYNIDGSKYICKKDGVSGAHSDIDGAEVAHLIWQAAMAGGSNV